MSASQFFGDVLHGNLSHALSRLQDWYSGWPPELKAFVASLVDDGGQILMAEARTALAGAVAGQTVAQIADSVWEDIKVKVPSKTKDDFMNALGVLVHAPVV